MAQIIKDNKLVTTLIAILIACLSYFLTTQAAKQEKIADEMQCTVARTEWASRNVYVDNQIALLRQEQRTDMAQINQKLDSIKDYLLAQKK